MQMTSPSPEAAHPPVLTPLLNAYTPVPNILYTQVSTEDKRHSIDK